eukprot:2019445-Alexandrium_andersonii.AAC.1
MHVGIKGGREIDDQHVGKYQVAEHNKNGDLVYEPMVQMGLCAVTTYPASFTPAGAPAPLT